MMGAASPSMTSPEATFTVLKVPPTTGEVVLFAVVRNEEYFLPHLVAHYRRLGIGEFWFLDDRSDDGTREFLMSQPDCGVIACNLTFGDKIGDKRFGVAAKTHVPRWLLMNRWVLTVDADEFLILPLPFETVPQLAASLQANGLSVARALMMDFFPPQLRGIEQASRDANPFELCPNFDPWRRLIWPDQAHNVSEISAGDGVRPRILARLKAIGADLGDLPATYKYASVSKAPLLFWQEDTYLHSAHRVSVPPSNRVQMVLAHFKFYPGCEKRVAHAVTTGVYAQNSNEYRILDVALRELADWPLQGRVSMPYRSREDLVKTGLLYSRLDDRRDQP
jgi:hypothetical protein